MRNMRSKKKIKRQQCATRESGGPFRKVCEGLAIHPFIIRELVTPFRSFSPSSDSSPSPPYHPLPFLPHSDPFISMFVTAFSVAALFETTLMGVNVKPISTAATRFPIFWNVLLYITGINLSSSRWGENRYLFLGDGIFRVRSLFNATRGRSR